MLEWLTANWGVIAAVITGLLTLAGLIVGLTKTKKDDKVFDVIRRVLSLLPGVKSPEQKREEEGTKLPLTTEKERAEDEKALERTDKGDSEDKTGPFRRSK